jgi:TrmH RNA methyltransferase
MDNDIICGFKAVAAVFRVRPGEIMRLYYTADARPIAGPFCAEMARTRRPYRELPPDEMARATGSTHHGGIVVIAKPRFVPILDRDNPPIVPFLLALDGVANPHNLGAIARSAVFFGVKELLLHEVPGAAMPSPAAYRTAEGAMEYLTIRRTRDLPYALQVMERHYRTVATGLSTSAAPLEKLPRDRPVALVLGNEEHGVSPAVLAACRREVRVEPLGPMQSLNVAQAAAVLLHALTLPGAVGPS